ncbi:MAG: hypothetical protein IPM29_21695 [Planctomycetes bacterium]|nr:hypothetical protein [Planctomycetota bacterium]
MPLILFLLSAVVLTLEVLETKIFAYSLENSLIFLVVGVVLLGFGAGGSVLAMRRQLGEPRRLVRVNLLVTAVLLVVAHAWFAHASDHLEFRLDFWTLSILLLLAAPYFSAGMAISAILADPAGSVHTRYGINLLGSAIGCVTVFVALGPLTGPELLIVCATVAALAAVPLFERRLPVLLPVLAVGALLFHYADRILPYRIQKAETAGQLALIEKTAAEIVRDNPKVARLDVVQVFDRWDPTARVQVHELDYDIVDDELRRGVDALPSMWFTQDSSYGSPLIGAGPAPAEAAKVAERSCYGFGYFRGERGMNVLVIGIGGAPDLQTALHFDAARITGVDINATTVAMGQGPLADFLGRPYDDPRVAIHLRDGRSFVRSSPERFDLIQLSGVDTKSVLASGTLALNESYLYTAEAFDEYLDHLSDRGLLVINYAADLLRMRLAVTALDALQRRGAADPTRHVMMLEQSAIFGLLVSPTPFTAEDCAKMRAWLEHADTADGTRDGQTGVVVWVYELLTTHLSLFNAPVPIYLPDDEHPTDPIMHAARLGQLDRFLDEHPRDLRPAPDWRPFFFNVLRNETVLDPETRPEHFRRSFRLLWLMLGMSVLLILGPLVVQGVRGLRAWSTLPFAVYFAALGAGYIMAMSGLIQRYVLFLGHQAYAFAAVIGGLLVAAGCGAMLAGRYAQVPRRVMTTAVVAICAMLAALHFGLDPLFSVTAGLPLSARVGIGLCVLFPLGVGLGAMFPTGLGIVKQRSPLFVPWAFGINGVFSVIGTSIVLPGAILYGFPAMIAMAGLVYAFALGVGLLVVRRPA